MFSFARALLSNHFLPSTKTLCFYHAFLFSMFSLLPSTFLSFPFPSPLTHLFDHSSSFSPLMVTCGLFLGLAVFTVTYGSSPVHSFGARTRRGLCRDAIPFSVSLTDIFPGLALNTCDSARHAVMRTPEWSKPTRLLITRGSTGSQKEARTWNFSTLLSREQDLDSPAPES